MLGRAVLGASVVLAVLAAGAGAGLRGQTATWQPPPPGPAWQWQLVGRVDESVDAEMFDIDLFDARTGEVNGGVIQRLHRRDKIVICYLDTGAWESYRPDAEAFPSSVIGRGTGWPGERWLDIRRTAWARFADIIWRRLDLARRLGCDGVEPDQNNPVGNNPGFPIRFSDEKAWYLEVARQAHRRGLSVGMKNGVEIVDTELVDAFDWALTEECFEYRECARFEPFVAADKSVFQVEYAVPLSRFCGLSRRLGFSAMAKRPALGRWRRACPVR